MATAGQEIDWNGAEHRHTLAGLIASLPHTVVIDRADGAPTPEIHAFLNRPVPSSIRGRTESRLFCRLSAGGMLVVGLSDEAMSDIVARGCGETVPGGVLLRMPTTDEELGACWSFIRQAHESLSAGTGFTRRFGKPLLPNFSRTRLQ